MVWWVTALIYIGLTLAYELIRPKPKFDTPEPAGISDFRIPTIGEGRVIPIVWGTVKVPGPMVVWYGDLDVVAIKKKVQTGLFSSEQITIGYKYYLGMDLVLCSGEIDEVLEVRFEDKPVPNTTYTYQPANLRTRVAMDAPDFYGGKEEEGGVVGSIDVYHGSAAQDKSDYLVDQLGASIPAHRAICHAVLRGVYLGNSPYIKDIAFVLKRVPNSLGLTGGDEDIDGDANPAAMIYSLLTDSPGKNGLGLPAGFIDVDSFRTIGDTLATEALGVSMMQDRASSAKDLVLEILRHIDGIMFVEPTTGLLTLTLVRADYEVGTLPELDEDNAIVESFTRSSWGEIKNQIKVAFVDRASGFIERTVQSQDLAAIEAAGGEVSSQDLRFRGYSKAGNAQDAAARALMALAYPLAAITLTADRSAWDFRPGTVFKLTWPKLGISEMVVRVLRIATGELADGRIRIEAFEDIFSIDWTAYTPPGSTGWNDPAGEEVPELEDQGATWAPYEATKFYTPPGSGIARALVVAARGTPGVTKGYRPLISGGGEKVQIFTPSGTLTGAITESSTTIEFAMGPDCDLVEDVNAYDYGVGLNVALIGGGTDPDQTSLEEWIAFQTIDVVGDNMTLEVLARGVLDTAPSSFASGLRVWIVSYGSAIVNGAGTGATTITFQPYNNVGVLPLIDCDDTVLGALPDPRPNRVYCPTDLKFNAQSYPTSIIGELTVSWEHRDRLGEWSYNDSGETSSPEAGTEYTLKIYGELDTLVHTESGITGKSYVYPTATEIAESGLGRVNAHLRIQLITEISTVEAFRMMVWEFDRQLYVASATGVGTASADMTYIP